MTKKLISLLLICFCITNSCVQSNKVPPVTEVEPFLLAENEVHEIDIESNLTITDGRMLLSDAVCDVEYIKLETTNESVLPPIPRIYVTDDYIVVSEGILDYVYVFTRKGKFVRKIGRIGSGPGEYLIARSFTCDDSLVYIQTNYLGKIMKYRLSDNSFRGSIPIESKTAQEIFVLPNNRMSTYIGSAAYIDDIYTALLINMQGDTIDYLRPNIDIDQLKKKARHVLTEQLVSWQTKDQVNVYEFNNDTIYGISSSGIFPRYKLDLGKYKMSEDVFYDLKVRFKEEPNCITIRTGIECSDYIYMSFNYQEDLWCAQYNKNNGKIKCWKGKKDDAFIFPFHNDVDGGNKVFTVNQIRGGYLGSRIDYDVVDEYLTPEHFAKSEVKFPEKQAELIRLIKELKEDDNPILALYKLK